MARGLRSFPDSISVLAGSNQNNALIVAEGLRGFRRTTGEGVQVPSSALSLALSLFRRSVNVETAMLLNSSSFFNCVSAKATA